MAELVRRGGRVARAPKASIVIPVLERTGALLRCLEALAALPPEAPAHEVIVVGNSTPDAALAALPRPETLVVIPSAVNLGFGGGCNWGARFARGRHLVFLNDDAEVEPGWLGALVRAAQADSWVGAVGSRLLNPDGRLQEAGCVLFADGSTAPVGRGAAAGSGAWESPRDVDYCSGCGLLVRREAFWAVGGFDERYFPAYYEDVDLCLRLRERGWRTVYAPEARVVHRGGGSTSEARRTLLGVHSGRVFQAWWGDRLAGHEPPPASRSREAAEAAVARAAARAQARAAAAESASGEGPPQMPPQAAPPAPSEAELLRAQVRALQAARDLQDAEMADLRREHAKLERLRRTAWRVPGGRGASAWLSRRLGPRG